MRIEKEIKLEQIHKIDNNNKKKGFCKQNMNNYVREWTETGDMVGK